VTSASVDRTLLWDLSDRLGLRAALNRVYRVQVRGGERIPASGPCVIVANHESVIDPWFLALATKRRIRYMAKAELWSNPLTARIFDSWGAFPVERGAGDTGAMGRAGELLEAGELLGVFPRGTSKPDGNRIWHRGAARLAIAYGVPLLPVRLEATRALHRRGPVLILVGEPIVVPRARPTIAAAKALTVEAEAAVEALAIP